MAARIRCVCEWLCVRNGGRVCVRALICLTQAALLPKGEGKKKVRVRVCVCVCECAR